MSNTTEAVFEGNIETHLTTNGWGALPPSSYDRDLGLFPEEVIAFVQESQPKAWNQLVPRHGGEATARQRLVKQLQRVLGAALVQQVHGAVIAQAAHHDGIGADRFFTVFVLVFCSVGIPARCQPSNASPRVTPVIPPR